MATKKISQLTPKGANLQTTDLFEISESNGIGGYVTKSITGEQILDATSFTGLNDAPTSYTGKSGNLVTVNAGETGLTFTPVSTPNQPVSIDVTQQTYYARLATGNTLKACTYNNGTGGVGATLTGNANGILSQSDQTDKVDNVTPALNDIILVKNQASALQNGLYVVTQLGSVSLPFILTRLEFYNEPSEVYPSVIFISEGTSNQSKYFTQDTDAPTIGTSSLVYLTYAVTPTPAQVIFVDTVTSAALPACTYANGSSVSAPGSGATLKANANGALGTINGVTMNINARIIVKNQANQAHNGIYQVIDQGTASRPWVLRRVAVDILAFYINREYPVTNPNSTFFGTRWSISSPLTMTNANWGTTNIVFSENIRNFANSDLTLTANRTHDFDGFKTTFDDAEVKIISDANGSGDIPFQITQANGTDNLMKVLGEGTTEFNSIVNVISRPTADDNYLNLRANGSSGVNYLNFYRNNNTLQGVVSVSDVCINASYNTGINLSVFNTGIIVGGNGSTAPATSTALDINSTTGALLLPRLTATQGSALTPTNGHLIYVTSTNGTFTSVGFWGYENGAWVKL